MELVLSIEVCAETRESNENPEVEKIRLATCVKITEKSMIFRIKDACEEQN